MFCLEEKGLLISAVTHVGSSIMVYRCFSASVPGHFVVIEGTMNYKMYQDIYRGMSGQKCMTVSFRESG